MRHRRRVKHFSRKPTARKALLRGLMLSLLEHGRIKTTVPRAKELRRHIERAITVGKRGGPATRRLLESRLPVVYESGEKNSAVESLMISLPKRFSNRAGGYTRIYKIGRRPGDTAEMAFIEFVDYDYSKEYRFAPMGEKKVAKQAASDTKAEQDSASSADSGEKKAKVSSEENKAKRVAARAVAAKRRVGRKMQRASRQSARG